MNLGSSMRRRRGGPGGERRPDRTSPRAGQFLRSGGWMGIAALGVILAGVGAGYLYATQVVFPEPEVAVADFRDVPDLRSMSIAEVEAALGPEGLVVGRIDSIRHPEIPSGLVFGQTPLPGQLAVEGAPVEVTVSLGPETRPVPDVSRLPAERAVTVLETTGFQVELDSLETILPAGRVVETSPETGEEVELPSTIRVTVSLGPPLVELPILLGMVEERALEVLDSLQLEVGAVDRVYRFGTEPGTVLEQMPEAGEVRQGSRVRLVVGSSSFLRESGDGGR